MNLLEIQIIKGNCDDEGEAFAAWCRAKWPAAVVNLIDATGIGAFEVWDCPELHDDNMQGRAWRLYCDDC